MIIKFKSNLNYDISSVVNEENKIAVERLVERIKTLDAYSLEYLNRTLVTYGDEHGKNFAHNIVSQSIVDNAEEKKLFLDIFRIIVNEYQAARPKEKTAFKNSQRENKWYSDTLFHPMLIPQLYELRHFIRSQFND